MLRFCPVTSRNCQGLTRRQLLQVAGIDLLGLSLASTWQTQATASEARPALKPANERSCIFIWLTGGPSQFETFDPKPKAKDDVRGPFGAINTTVPGTKISELLPLLAAQADKYALIRSLTHDNSSHNSVAMCSGFETRNESFGAVVTKLRGSESAMPPYFHIGSKPGDGSCEITGLDMVGGGTFGSAFSPLTVRDPTGKKVELPDLSLASGISPDRFQDRRALLAAVDSVRAELSQSIVVEKMDRNYQRAAELLTSTRVREAFDLERESADLRTRYGANFFGQSCLLSRRLVEAGTRFVQLKWYDCIAFDAWDTHGAELPGMMRLEQQLCPRLDLGLSMLIDDLSQRGLLESTLVVVVGEFGRTPLLNKFGDRDHWPYCFSSLMAGGGVPGGAVIGASDDKGAYPAQRPVTPPEFAATIYKLLGIDTSGDLRVRPFIGSALPVVELTGGV